MTTAKDDKSERYISQERRKVGAKKVIVYQLMEAKLKNSEFSATGTGCTIRTLFSIASEFGIRTLKYNSLGS